MVLLGCRFRIAFLSFLLFFELEAVFESVLFQFVGLSGHGSLSNGDTSSVDYHAVHWYVVPTFDPDHISNLNIVEVDFLISTVSLAYYLVVVNEIELT